MFKTPQFKVKIGTAALQTVFSFNKTANVFQYFTAVDQHDRYKHTQTRELDPLKSLKKEVVEKEEEFLSFAYSSCGHASFIKTLVKGNT